MSNVVDKKMISFTIPCRNEEGNVSEMVEAISKQMLLFPDYEYEIIFRDNDSSDSTLVLLRKIASQNKKVKVIVNSRNFENTNNTFIGRVAGDVIIGLACDFQDPPEMIPDFIKAYEEGYDVVCGQKISSEESVIKYKMRHLFYKIIDYLSPIPQYQHLSGIVLMSKRFRDMYLSRCKEIKWRYYLAECGCEIKIIPYKQRKRKSGRSKFSVWKYLNYAINAMTETSFFPLRIVTVFGFFSSIISFLIGVYYMGRKLINWNEYQAGMALVVVAVFFACSIQLMFLGIIGEYVGAILKMVSPKAPAIVKELINFDPDTDEYTFNSSQRRKK